MARDQVLLLQLTHRLLDAIRDSDWATYVELCDPALTCFEPETRGELVEGLSFHKFYFDLGGHLGKHFDTVVQPRIRLFCPHVALVTYVRIVQRSDETGTTTSSRFEETRIWHKTKAGWKHIHFHRSALESPGKLPVRS